MRAVDPRISRDFTGRQSVQTFKVERNPTYRDIASRGERTTRGAGGKSPFRNCKISRMIIQRFIVDSHAVIGGIEKQPRVWQDNSG